MTTLVGKLEVPTTVEDPAEGEVTNEPISLPVETANSAPEAVGLPSAAEDPAPQTE